LNDNQREWLRAKDDLVREIKHLGFPGELGELMQNSLEALRL